MSLDTEGRTCQSCSPPQGDTAQLSCLAVAVTTSPKEEVESKKQWVTTQLAQLCGLWLKKPLSPAAPRFLRKDPHDLGKEREREGSILEYQRAWKERAFCRLLQHFNRKSTHKTGSTPLIFPQPKGTLKAQVLNPQLLQLCYQLLCVLSTTSKTARSSKQGACSENRPQLVGRGETTNLSYCTPSGIQKKGF